MLKSQENLAHEALKSPHLGVNQLALLPHEPDMGPRLPFTFHFIRIQ